MTTDTMTTDSITTDTMTMDSITTDDMSIYVLQKLQNEEQYAKNSCRSKMIEYIISQINYKKEKGIDALNLLDDDLYYLTQTSRIKFYITMPEYFESESWLFTSKDLLKYKSDLSNTLQQHCSLGWLILIFLKMKINQCVPYL